MHSKGWISYSDFCICKHRYFSCKEVSQMKKKPLKWIFGHKQNLFEVIFLLFLLKLSFFIINYIPKKLYYYLWSILLLSSIFPNLKLYTCRPFRPWARLNWPPSSSYQSLSEVNGWCLTLQVVILTEPYNYTCQLYSISVLILTSNFILLHIRVYTNLDSGSHK